MFDVPAKKLTQITSGDFDDDQPAWSPDGRFVVFVSNRDKEPDATFNTDLWLVASDNPDRGQTMVRLTHNPGEDAGPAWSPDGRRIVYVTNTVPELLWYGIRQLAVIPSQGGTPRLRSERLDRNIDRPRFSPDGKSIYFIWEDRGEQRLARMPSGGGEIERLIDGRRVVTSFTLGGDWTPVAARHGADLPSRGLRARAGEIAAADPGERRPHGPAPARGRREDPVQEH